jgi:hypothetical protein
MNMKKFIKFSKHAAFLGSILCIVWASCSDMNELADRFYVEGEIIYASKIDSAIAHIGYKKVGIDIFISTERISKVRVYWNNYQDSADIPVNNSKGVINKTFENMGESSYIFQIVSIDNYGNKSLPIELSGEAIGDNFMSLLRNRNVMSAIYSDVNEVTVSWGNSPNYNIGCKLTYTNTSDETVTVDVPAQDNATVIPDWKAGLSYYTRFVVNEDAMDTLIVDTVNNVDIWEELGDKSAWEVFEYTGDQHNDMSPDKAIDNDPMSTWHTKADLDFPYYIIIDLGASLQIDGIVFQNRIDDLNGGTNWPKKVMWETSDDLGDLGDLANWTTVLEFSEMTRTKDELWLPCSVKTTARYLKFNMYSGWNNQPYGYIGEMGIFRFK